MLADRIKVTTTTSGTGAITLASTGVRDATNGDCLAPAEVSALSGALVPYSIVSGNNFAYGTGQLSSDGLTLTRDVSEQSWNGSAFAVSALSLSGTSTVFITPHSDTLSASSLGQTLVASRGALWG